MSLFPVLYWPWPMPKTQGHHDFSIQNINKLKYVSSPCVYYVSWFHFLRGRIRENLPQGPSYQFICPHLGGECGCDQCGWSTLRETAAGVGVSLSMYIHHLSVHIFWILFISCYVHDVVIWNFGILEPSFLVNCQLLGGFEVIILWIWNWSIIMVVIYIR